MYYACFCKEFGVGEAWETPAPEDGGRVALVEWATGWTKELLKEEMETEVEEESESDTEWVILEDDEDGWSVVSEESEFSLV
jgi:hypothetical protein